MGRSEENDRISVSSVVYNMAGSEEGRINFLRSLITGAIQKSAGVADTIITGYQTGPGMRYRNFANWAKHHTTFTDTFGISSGSLAAITTLDRDAVAPEIAATLSAPIEVDNVESAEFHEGRIHFWVLQYMYANLPNPSQIIPRPPPMTGNNTYSYDSGTNKVTIKFPLGVSVDFTPTGYTDDPSARFLYVKYNPVIPGSEGSISYGSYVYLADGDPDPTFGSPWLKVTDDTASDFTATLEADDASDSTFSDGRSDEHHDFAAVFTSASAPQTYVHYIKDVYGGTDGNGAAYWNRTHKEFWVEYSVDTRVTTTSQTVTLTGGVTRTDTITRTEEYLKKTRKTRESTQTITSKTLLPPRWFIYKKGTGNSTLDAMMVDPSGTDLDGIFYPPIPFRLNNEVVGPPVKAAKRWLIETGSLGFTWDDDRYKKFLDSEKRDIQVAKSLDGPWVSLLWISAGPTTGTYYVEARPVSDDADVAGDPADQNDYDIEVEYYLNRIFSNASDDKPGYFRVRDWNQAVSNAWNVISGPTQLLSKPVPSTHGLTAGMEDKYNIAKRAFKKAYGGSFDDVLANINENDNIKNIDYAYAIFGVSLNVKEDACKRYIYKFLLHLMEVGGTSEADDFLEAYAAAHDSNVAWRDWWEATHQEDGTPSDIQATSDDGENVYPPPPEPERLPYPTLDWHTLNIRSNTENYDTGLSWAFIRENTGHGALTKPDTTTAAAGELWFHVESDIVEVLEEWTVGPVTIRTPPEYSKLRGNRVTLNWQVTANSWRQLDITGLTYFNNIYKDHSISYTAAESVNWTKVEHSVDADGNQTTHDTGIYEESPFIFPLHETVFKEISIVDCTQMAHACTFLMFNCYEEREEKWYETTVFKVVLVVVILAIAILAAIFTGGTSLGAGGTAVATVLFGLGASETLAIIVGVLADFVIGYALSYLTTFLATAIFGEKVGSVIGALLGLVLGGFVNGGFDVDALTKTFTTAEGWLALTPALTNAGGKLLEIQAQENLEATIRTIAKTNEEMAKVQELFNKQFAKKPIDPVAVNKYIKEALERPDAFLRRTQMVGSDIVKATLDEVNAFVDTRLSLALP